MPHLEQTIPEQSRMSIKGREIRAGKLMRHLQITEPVQIALGVRRDYRTWAKIQQAALSMGDVGVENAARAAKVLAELRGLMLDLVGYPKRPGRVPPEQIRQIQEAIPAEITIESSDNQSH